MFFFNKIMIADEAKETKRSGTVNELHSKSYEVLGVIDSLIFIGFFIPQKFAARSTEA